jgi:hypothetical protein
MGRGKITERIDAITGISDQRARPTLTGDVRETVCSACVSYG